MFNKKCLPNFLFIGPDKTGSSWMYSIFRQHPLCFVPVAKDIWFFDKYYERGIDWYLSFFQSDSDDIVAIGELSHNYIFSSQAAQRIAYHFPNICLLTCLRDPVYRTYSHYLYLIRSGLTRLTFEYALETFSELIEHSLYHKHLSTYLNFFSKEQIKILWFEQLTEDPKEFAREIFQFLQLEMIEDIDYNQTVRPASKPRNLYLARALTLSGRLIRHLGFVNTVGRIKNSQWMHLFYRPYQASEKPKLSMQTEKELRQLFAPDIRALQDAFDVDLQQWLPD